MRDVHLIDLAAARTAMRHEVVRTGKIVFRTPDADVDAFLDFVLRDYVRLEEARAGILRDVHERGRVHGR